MDNLNILYFIFFAINVDRFWEIWILRYISFAFLNNILLFDEKNIIRIRLLKVGREIFHLCKFIVSTRKWFYFVYRACTISLMRKESLGALFLFPKRKLCTNCFQLHLFLTHCSFSPCSSLPENIRWKKFCTIAF